MPNMDLKIVARVNGPEDDDGMRLAELEATLASIRTAGGQDSTRVKVDTSRKARVRAVTGQIRADDTSAAITHENTAER